MPPLPSVAVEVVPSPQAIVAVTSSAAPASVNFATVRSVNGTPADGLGGVNWVNVSGASATTTALPVRVSLAPPPSVTVTEKGYSVAPSSA